MSRITLDEIANAEPAKLQEWLSSYRFKITMTNWNASTEEERKNTLIPLNGEDLSKADVQGQTEEWARQTRPMFISVVELCELVAENNIETFRELGEFHEYWRTETIYLLIVQYLDKLNTYWKRNSFALLPPEDMALIKEDVEKLERLAKLLHNEAKYQMEVRLINEETKRQLKKTDSFRRLIEEDTYTKPWDADLFGEMLYQRHNTDSGLVELDEREKYVSPVSATALKQDYDLSKNRTKRW